MSDLHDFAARFRGAVPTQGGRFYKAFCPLHKGGQERNRSLMIWETPEGNIWVHCFSCGPDAKKDILALVGAKLSDLFKDRPKRQGPKPMLKIVARYDYRYEDGTVGYRVFRHDPKSFSQAVYDKDYINKGLAPDHTDQHFAPGLRNCRRVLYRLPELLSADPNLWVCYHEGERKADLTASWGFPSTTNQGGAGMGWKEQWRDVYGKTLSGRKVAVFPDNNQVGREFADTVVGCLIRHGASAVKLVNLPGLPDGGDVIDWHKAGGTTDQFLSILLDARTYRC